MKILITGASGKIGSLARDLFKAEQVTIVSRKHCECKYNEVWISSSSLNDVKWWSDLGLVCEYDLVLHFAEPVKKKSKTSDVLKIIESHTAFIKNASQKSHLVIYPQTALVYDCVLSEAEKSYVEIKRNVIKKLAHINNLYYPIIHPVVDYGDGLSRMRNIFQKLPFINMFCEFKSTIPVLYKKDLEFLLLSIRERPNDTKRDFYSCELSVSDIFHSEHKKNVVWFSCAMRKCLVLFEKNPRVLLLLNGRSLK